MVVTVGDRILTRITPIPIPTSSPLAPKVLRKLPLRLVLTLPFVLQTVGAVALVGYLSFRSGQQAVAELANDLMGQQGDRIVQNLESYLKTPKDLVREHQTAIRLGILEWQNTSLMETYFAQQLNIHTDVSSLVIGTERKDFLAVTHPEPNQLVIRQRNPETGALENYVADLQGNRLYLRDAIPNYDPHADPPTHPWYRAAKESKEGHWQLVVSLARGKEQPLLVLAYFLPFVDPPGQFQGVLSGTVFLNQTGEYLRSLRIGKTGQAFIMDEKGLLIATSTTELPFRRNPSIKLKETSPPEALRLAAQDSQNPVTRAAADWSLNPDAHPRRFRLQNQQYFGRVIPFKLDDQINWTIVVVIPESDFMAEIQTNVHRTALLCSLALLGAIGSGIWTSRRITRSLLRLTQATQAVAAGMLEQPLPVTRIAEVECLTQSFHQMVMDLQKADQLRQSYAQDLERQVAEKTAAFTEAQRIAKVGSWEFNLATQEVIWSEELYRIYEAEDQAPVPRPDLTIQHIHPDDQERFQRQVVEVAIALQPFDTDLRIITQNGNIRYIQAKGQPIANAQGEVVKLVGTVADITDQKAAEIAWRESELKFSSIFHTSPDPAWIATLAEGRVLNTNDRMATFLGYSQAEMLGKTCVELNLWVNHEDLAYFRKQLTQNRNIQDFEVVFRLKSGERRTVLLSAIVSHLNCQDCVIGLLKDISDRKQAEIALKQSESRFRRLAESNIVGIIMTTATGEISEANDGFLQMVGYDRADLLAGKLRWDRITPSDYNEVDAAAVVHLLTHGWVQPFEKEYIRKDGSRVAVLVAGAQVEESENEVISVILDISDRKRTEAALRQSEQRYLAIIEDQTELIARFLPDGTITFVNEAYCRYFGFTREELIGYSVEPLIVEDDLEYVYQRINSMTLDNPVITVENRVIVGNEVRSTQWINRALFDEQGCLVEVQAVGRDITDRKRAEAALRQSEERFQEIASTINQLFFIRCAKSRQFLYVSPAYEKIFERSCESLYQNSESWLETIHPDDRQQIITSVFQQFQGNNVTREYRILRPNHSIRWIYVQISLLQDEAGNPLRFIGFAEDITERKQIEENLQRYERIVSATADGIALLDRNYIYQVVNQTYLTWHNKSYEEIVGHSIKDILGSNLFETLVKERLDRCLAGETIRYQHWFEFKTNPTTKRFLNVTYSPCLEVDNTISGVVVGLRDLTEQKQAEDALRQSEERLQYLLTASPAVIFSSKAEGDYRATFMSQNVSTILGYDAENFLDSAQFWSKLVYPGDLEGIVTSLPQLFEQGSCSYEYRFLHADGTYHWLGTQLKLARDEAGNPLECVGYLIDINDKKQAEIALKESESRFLEISDSSPANIYIFVRRIDGSFYFEHMSRAIEVIHEISVKQILENANILLDAIYPEDQAGYEAAVQYSMETLQLFQHQWRIITPSGKIKWLQGNSRPKRRDNGEIAWHGIVIDISDRKQAEQELQQAKEAAEAANRAKSNFLANMSHELRTPLNGIMGYAQILQQDKNCTPKQKEGISIIYQCGTHLLTLINDILDLSKIEAEKLELYPENFHFPSFLTALTEIFRLKSEQKKLTFTYLPLIEIPTVIYADQKRLRQVLMNLLSNAVKFSDRGSVTFKVSLATDVATDLVTDVADV
ncbi:MAG TPA: hypothetical protein DCY91_21320, partial [Cyanobacteria bacterium UBA11370]|nr:hypothetical protein [Cyanobacteria bacterium UBA11370]